MRIVLGVSADQDEALFSYALLRQHRNSCIRVRCMFSRPDSRWLSMKLISSGPCNRAVISTSILDVINGAVISGDALTNFGVQLPIMLPQSLLIFIPKALGMSEALLGFLCALFSKPINSALLPSTNRLINSAILTQTKKVNKHHMDIMQRHPNPDKAGVHQHTKNHCRNSRAIVHIAE